jgi:hypothetical protein
MTYDVAVGIENADTRHFGGGKTLLPTRFTQQCGRLKHRSRR